MLISCEYAWLPDRGPTPDVLIEVRNGRITSVDSGPSVQDRA